MRNTFIQSLIDGANANDKIVLIIGDLGFSVVEPFLKKFPLRSINSGVAEQNMTGIAAGMASEGCHVFTYSIANFPIFRCAEQIRNDIDYHNLPVTIVSVGSGLAYGNLGYSHHGIQDFSLIRSMPNRIIGAPADPFETSSIVEYFINNPQPSYLRLNKAGEKNINKIKPILKPGLCNYIIKRKEAQNLILSTGATLDIAVQIAKENEEICRSFDVASMPIWGESSRIEIYNSLRKYENIISLEEHLLSGGFGSFLLESGLNCHPVFLSSDVCGTVGDQNYLKEKFGLSKNVILKKINDFMIF